jgi:hypothetical protein
VAIARAPEEHGAAETQLSDGPLEFVGGCLGIRRWQGCKRGQAVGMGGDCCGRLVVRFPSKRYSVGRRERLSRRRGHGDDGNADSLGAMSRNRSSPRS